MIPHGKHILILGGGVIGVACAHYLHQAGYQVTVIDQHTIAGACSHGNCGYVCPSHVLPLTEPAAIGIALRSLFNPNAPFYVKPTLDPETLKWFWQFAKRCRHKSMIASGRPLKAILDASMAAYHQLVKEEGLKCEWRDSGLLYVLRSQRAMADFAATDQLLTREFNVSARRIEGPELCSLDPSLKPGLAGAFLYETDTMLRPDRLCREWRERLMCRGVRFVESCEVLSAEKEADGIECVITSKGPMTADGYVLATGARSGQLGHLFGCYLPIQPGKGYSVTMPRPAICPSYPMLFPEHRVGVTPFQEGYRLGSMMEFVGFDEQIPSSRVEQLKRSAEPYLKQPHTDGQSETWYGWRPMTWDSLPAIGPASGLRNAYVATGHNMLGLSMAPATGKMIAAMIAGKGPELDPSPFDPARFARA